MYNFFFSPPKPLRSQEACEYKEGIITSREEASVAQEEECRGGWVLKGKIF
jgi:hypothetical protein